MGPTMEPIFSFGVKPAGMNRAVMMPQAMKAPMFGMIMEERKVPNFCTRTRAPPFFFSVCAGADAVAVVDKGLPWCFKSPRLEGQGLQAGLTDRSRRRSRAVVRSPVGGRGRRRSRRAFGQLVVRSR